MQQASTSQAVSGESCSRFTQFGQFWMATVGRLQTCKKILTQTSQSLHIKGNSLFHQSMLQIAADCCSMQMHPTSGSDFTCGFAPEQLGRFEAQIQRWTVEIRGINTSQRHGRDMRSLDAANPPAEVRGYFK